MLSLPAVAASHQDAGPPPETDLASTIRRNLEAAQADPHATFEGETIASLGDVRTFYEARAFHPAWLGVGDIASQGPLLLQELRATAAEGLRPADYHEPFLAMALSVPPTQLDGAAALDLLLTDGFLLCARHYTEGRLNPAASGIAWSIDRPQLAFPAMLEEALRAGSVAETLRGLLPADPAYGHLRGALARYRGIAAAGGWHQIDAGPPLRTGSREIRVPAVRRQLAAELGRDLESEDPQLLDDALASVVAEFQRHHGLDPDGVVGARTLAALNQPVEARIDQIAANMERWRWLPVVMAARRIVVNIAEFRLRVFEGNHEVLSMKAIVGQPYRQTPVFTAPMTYLVFGPYWNVPDSIARNEILARARRSPAFLARERIRIFRSWSESEPPLSPWRIAWQRLSSKRFPFRLRQDPGPANPLGRVKFVLPNPFDVYLHDTPARALFERASRPFSHGCVRLERPADLAAYLLGADKAWTRDRIEETMGHAVDEAVRLPEPIPVYLLYLTAWADEGGAVQFRDDVYGRDAALMRALAAK